MPPAPTHNREAWLNRAVELMRIRLFAEHDFHVPQNIRISVGFPKGARKGQHAIGQCFHQDSSGDGHAEIFIHPEIEEPTRVLDIVSHELVHAINFSDGENGHGKPFKQIATKIGLEGRMTATVAGPDLLAKLTDYAQALGEYPHKALTFVRNSGPKKQTTRMLKIVCPGCDYTARTSSKWIDVGLPTCCCGVEFVPVGAEIGEIPE